MKYKYTRKQWLKLNDRYLMFQSQVDDLLATKPSTASSKECKHTYQKVLRNGDIVCKKCEHLIGYPTPPKKKIEKLPSLAKEGNSGYDFCTREKINEIIDYLNK